MMELGLLIEGIVILATAGLALIAVIAHITARQSPSIYEHEDENLFLNDKKSVPSLHDPATYELSVVVPSYNEEERLPSMMNEALDYLEMRQKQDPSFTYEIIVVDDGSTDKTTKVALRYVKKYGSNKVRVLTLVRNRGKGGAVRREMMAIACGSRAHLEKDSIAQRSYFRTFLMHGFHFLVRFLCVKDIRDTQCGFKLLTREAASRTFSALHIERWAFDVELLYIAQSFKIPITEIAVNWTEIEGSKLVPFWSWLQMGRDLLFIRLRYLTGAWKFDTRKLN
ncbi:dolichyl-phosphate beta-glucosyltransferase isoform X2 [Crotalus tigris]|uniref:dolichyl-phosphate beta-glucosyltransferase isoform X2 n=1 Tax=Crotalus tigris TaxID=88082 RepID=UPI00192F9E49|nr:dolichyl-phosphate beta-glucosyltransferase isoform X2 [Crotalus tigris]